MTSIRWTRGRIVLAVGLALHWAAVLVWAVPDGGWRRPVLGLALPLPRVSTHPGDPLVRVERQSVVQAWLMAANQTQRWRMFTPRRPNTAYIELALRSPDGSATVGPLRTLAGHPQPRGMRWRFLEWSLMNPDRRASLVPAALPVLARALGAAPGDSVVAHKIAYPVPLLSPDGTGNPRFESASAYRDVLARRDRWAAIPLGAAQVTGDPR